MKALTLILFFIGYCTLSYSQCDKVFVTEPEIQYDVYYKSCDALRDSLSIFFAERKNYIPESYNKGVKIFFTAKTDGRIENIIFWKTENKFDDELYSFLENFKFDNPLIKYYRGDTFNTRLKLLVKYNDTTTLLNIGIDILCYWKNNRINVKK